MAKKESEPQDIEISEATSEADIDDFEQREDQVVALLRAPAGIDTDVKLVFRQQVVAGKPRCFFCVLIGGQIRCIEVRCPRGPRPRPGDSRI